MTINKYRTLSNKLILLSSFLFLFVFLFTTSTFGQIASEKLEEAIKEETTKQEATKKVEKSNKKETSNKMTVEKMDKILKNESKKVGGQLGNWQVEYKGLPFIVITDVKANRMRIISPIVEDNKLAPADLVKLMEANFSRALDAKYSIYQKVLWSSYAHPLGELTENQFKDALNQVYNLVKNYGTTYSSTGVVFGETQEPKKEVIN